jgi:hypothetical protein
VLIAFDLIELEGEDLRGSTIEHRKRKLAKLVRGPHPGIVLNEFFEGDGDILFEHACKLGAIAMLVAATAFTLKITQPKVTLPRAAIAAPVQPVDAAILHVTLTGGL